MHTISMNDLYCVMFLCFNYTGLYGSDERMRLCARTRVCMGGEGRWGCYLLSIVYVILCFYLDDAESLFYFF